MFKSPPIRRLLVPCLICLAFIIAYRSSNKISNHLGSFIFDHPSISGPGQRVALSELVTVPVAIQDAEGNRLQPPKHLYYKYDEPSESGYSGRAPVWTEPSTIPHLDPLLECRVQPNRYTDHIRLTGSTIRKISMISTGDNENEFKPHLNAALMSLPSWSENQYLLVTRVQTDGSMQLNALCEANICYTDPELARPGEKPCTPRDLELLDGVEGLRCATPPIMLNVPPTPAHRCGRGTGPLIDIPGFHDPRIFWSGKGEPLMMVNSQSRYSCFGLWVIDLRALHLRLDSLLSRNVDENESSPPLMSYQTLTEITRNPPETRGLIEKNWMFFSNKDDTYVHYDMGPQIRTFAKLLGAGFTTPNLTDPLEQPCLEDALSRDKRGSWHQGTNSLQLVLCERADPSCRPSPENTVFWSLIHHKHKNYYKLPLRYERYFIVWSSTPPFSMLAISKFPINLANETATGWDSEENWDDDEENAQLIREGKPGKGPFAIFTYTPSIAYAWGRKNDPAEEKNVGYLDDEVILGLGIDDTAQAYARAKVTDLLQCMRTCPGRSEKLRIPDHLINQKEPIYWDSPQAEEPDSVSPETGFISSSSGSSATTSVPSAFVRDPLGA